MCYITFQLYLVLIFLSAQTIAWFMSAQYWTLLLILMRSCNEIHLWYVKVMCQWIYELCILLTVCYVNSVRNGILINRLVNLLVYFFDNKTTDYWIIWFWILWDFNIPGLTRKFMILDRHGIFGVRSGISSSLKNSVYIPMCCVEILKL